MGILHLTFHWEERLMGKTGCEGMSYGGSLQPETRGMGRHSGRGPRTRGVSTERGRVNFAGFIHWDKF